MYVDPRGAGATGCGRSLRCLCFAPAQKRLEAPETSPASVELGSLKDPL